MAEKRKDAKWVEKFKGPEGERAGEAGAQPAAPAKRSLSLSLSPL